ncbi:MAG: transglycosylase family protein [Sciscionella sp.]
MNGYRRVRRVLSQVVLVIIAAMGLSLVGAGLAGADPSASTWAKLRQCESSGNYDVVSSTGKHMGAYQFDESTWRSVGGTGAPNRASRSEQDFRALYLYRMRGWQPWQCAQMLGLRGDSDAASGIRPSYADSGYISGSTSRPPSHAPTTMPKWDGLVYFKGDCADSLRTFQLRMNVMGSGYKFQGTGCYEGHTYAAVVALQKANGINPSGRLGPKTWHAAWHGKKI